MQKKIRSCKNLSKRRIKKLCKRKKKQKAYQTKPADANSSRVHLKAAMADVDAAENTDEESGSGKAQPPLELETDLQKFMKQRNYDSVTETVNYSTSAHHKEAGYKRKSRKERKAAQQELMLAQEKSTG